MKRIVSAWISAAVMVAFMGMTVFAQSVSAWEIPIGGVHVPEADMGVTVDIDVVTSQDVVNYPQITTVESEGGDFGSFTLSVVPVDIVVSLQPVVPQVAGDLAEAIIGPDAGVVAASAHIMVNTIVDIVPEKIADGNITLRETTIHTETETTKVRVFHMIEGTSWEVIVPSAVGEGFVTFQAPASFSPFAVVTISVEKTEKDTSENPSESTGGDSTETQPVTSPKTGDPFLAVGAVTAVFMVGIGYSARKRKG